MLKKLFIPIVIVMLLFASTLAMAAKPSDLPDQAYLNGQKKDIEEFLIQHFIDLLTRIYDKNGLILTSIEDRLFVLTGR